MVVDMSGMDAMEAVLLKLRGCLDAGYLLHGSKQSLEVLEPRRARDADPSNIIGNQTAVYAAKSVRIPIIKALIITRDASVAARYGYEDDGNRIVVRGANFTFTPGFVYVIRPDSFIEIRDDRHRKDIVSYKPVIPHDRIFVTPTILKHVDVCVIDDASLG